ncbi:hypothetical protein [Haloechinothrix salitolerans]|uniref:Uncharacterized protein n=1 Tax=Haloechinothrix salitolerans TaxID=926830 RepID=A0ABW2C8K7_9PSEU
MSTPHNRCSVGILRAITALTLLWFTATGWVEDRWRQACARRDAGSETVEKAVIVAVVLGLAVGLAAAIAAVVDSYRGRISP